MRNILRVGNESRAGSRKRYRISREEAEILSRISDDAFDEASEDMEAATRLAGVTDALEDLACIADSIEEVSPAENALIQTASRMAVAGTDVEPSEIVPEVAMESLGRPGMEVAEALRERAKAIWDGVMKTVSGAWEKITTWLSNLFSHAEFLRSSAEDVRAEIKKHKERMEKPLSITADFVEYFSTASKTITNVADLKKQLAIEMEAGKWVLEVYTKDLLAIGDKLAKAYASFDLNNIDGFINAIKSAVTKDLKFPGRKQGDSHRFPNAECFVGHELLNRLSLVLKVGTPKVKGDHLAELDALYNTELLVDDTTVKSKTHQAFEFDMPSADECLGLLDIADQFADEIEKFSRGALPKELQAVRKEIDEAIAKCPDAIEKAFNSDELSQEQQATLKAAAMMTVAFTNWTKDPIRGIINQMSDSGHIAIWVAALGEERFNPRATIEDEQEEQ